LFAMDMSFSSSMPSSAAHLPTQPHPHTHTHTRTVHQYDILLWWLKNVCFTCKKREGERGFFGGDVGVTWVVIAKGHAS
jgi:hypothetical protein